MLGTQKSKSIFVGFCKFIVKSHWQTVLFAILYIIGLSVGAVFFFTASPDTYKQLCRLSGEYLLSRSHWEKAVVFASSFLSVFWFLLLFFLLGSFPFGRFLTFPLIFCRGLGTGIAIASLCSQNETESFLLLIFILQSLLFFRVGKCIWSDISQKQNRYRKEFLILTLFSALTALLDVFLSG